MPTLLHYKLTTQPFPLQANAPGGSAEATLTVVASNPNPSTPVTLQGVSITLLVGPDASELTADASGVGPVAPPFWKLHETKKSDHAVEYVFWPEDGHGAVGGQGLAFIFSHIRPNRQPGPTTVTVTEGSAGNPTTGLLLPKFPSTWGEVSFSASPADVLMGGSTTLGWSGPAGATYTIEYSTGDGAVVNLPPAGQPAFGSSGQWLVSQLDQTTVFTLEVSETIEGQPYQAQQQKTVTVDVPAPTLLLTATPTVIDVLDRQPVQLQWTTTNASTLKIDGVGSFNVQQVASGSTTDTPPVQRQNQPHVYTATAFGLAGFAGPPATATATVTFNWVKTVESDWLGDFATDGTTIWSLKLGDGRHALDVAGKSGSGFSSSFTEVFARLAPGVQAADLGTGGANTTSSQVAAAIFGDSLPHAGLMIRVSEVGIPSSGRFPQSENVNQTWAIKFPDGLIVVVWYTSLNLRGIFGSHWQLTFGLMAYVPGMAA
jgi:hypothetical protein